ncbi:hypothetical protein P3732_25275, partial [Vibrio parahaemolyticus]|nr:hypothetical protein [Vibrio parahaemolyticus]
MSDFQPLVESNRRLTETVENKMGDLDKKVEEVEAAAKNAVFTEMKKTIYVDQLNGNDSNA